MSIENDLKRLADSVEKLVVYLMKPINVECVTGVPETRVTTTAGAAQLASVASVAETEPAPAPVKRGRPAKSAAEPVQETTAVVTKDDVTNTLREYVRVNGKPGEQKAKEMLLEFGAGRISEIDPKHYAELDAKLKAGLK